jgi:hypothetical protein
MDCYAASDVSVAAAALGCEEVAAQRGSDLKGCVNAPQGGIVVPPPPFGPVTSRVPLQRAFLLPPAANRVRAHGVRAIQYGEVIQHILRALALIESFYPPLPGGLIYF